MMYSTPRPMAVINKLILLALFLTPIYSLQESLALIFLEQRGFVHTSNILSSIYIKGLKDLFSILIVLICLFKIIQTLSIKRQTSIFLSTIIFLILLPAYYYHDNILVYLSGIRWLMPFILAAFLVSYIDEKLLFKIGTILFYLFFIHFIMQLVQLFYSYGYFGQNSLGLSSRNPGIFYVPSTAAVFAIIVLFFCKFYMKRSFQNKVFYLIPISIFLTSSGTGIGIYVIFIFIFYLRKSFLPYLPIIIFSLAVGLILSLDLLSGRSGLVENSLGIRYYHFKEALLNGHYFPEDFGYGTATAELIMNRYDMDFNMIITHSWYASSIVNLGLINSILIIILLFIIFVMLTKAQDKEKLIFLTIFSMFALTTPVAESYPANLLFAILLAYYIEPKKVSYESTDQSIET